MYIVYIKSTKDLAWNEHAHLLRLGLINSYSSSVLGKQFLIEHILLIKPKILDTSSK